MNHGVMTAAVAVVALAITWYAAPWPWARDARPERPTVEVNARAVEEWLRVEGRLESVVLSATRSSAEVRKVAESYRLRAERANDADKETTEAVLEHCELMAKGLETGDDLLVRQQVMALERLLPNVRARLLRALNGKTR